MVENAFLDKGVLLGYCFFTDPHHTKCKEYIYSNSKDYFTTEQVENVFNEKKEAIIDKHRNGILTSIRHVKSEFSGRLSESDIDRIQDDIDREKNDAWRYLLDFYNDKANEDVYEITEELRNKLHKIESQAKDRKEELYRLFQRWLRISNHQEVREKLEPLRERDEEDLEVCIDAHDVAANVEGKTELATTDPGDFAKEEIRTLILEHTNIDNIRLVFAPRSYSPEASE